MSARVLPHIGGRPPKKTLTYRRQRPIKGGRLPAHSDLIPEIEQALRAEMDRYQVSRSFVIATALAYVFRIDEQERYNDGVWQRVSRRA